MALLLFSVLGNSRMKSREPKCRSRGERKERGGRRGVDKRRRPGGSVKLENESVPIVNANIAFVFVMSLLSPQKRLLIACLVNQEKNSWRKSFFSCPIVLTVMPSVIDCLLGYHVLHGFKRGGNNKRLKYNARYRN